MSKEAISILVNIECRDVICLEIENTVNRPNNPEIADIVRAYVHYHFGNVSFQWEEMESYIFEGDVEYIGEDWNIENFM